MIEPHNYLNLVHNCDTVNEVADETIAGQLGAISSQHGFSPLSSTVELKGKCGNCNKQ